MQEVFLALCASKEVTFLVQINKFVVVMLLVCFHCINSWV